MGLTRDQVHDRIKELFSDAVIEDERGVVDPWITVKPESLLEVARGIKEDATLSFDLLNLISGIDYPDTDTIEVVYCLDSTTKLHTAIVKVKLPRANPVVASLESVWRTADWHERETFDLVGVKFEGHPNLVRILCAEDWEGHPLRKDYVIPDSYRGIKNVVY